MSSLALLAAGAPATAPVAVAVRGGHGELFVQQFDASSAAPVARCSTCRPPRPPPRSRAELVVGPGAAELVAARGWGEALDAWPSAADALRLPEALRTLAAEPALCPGARRPRPRRQA